MSTRPFCLLSLLALSVPACGGQSATASDDASLADDAKADRSGSASSSYFLIHADLRRCAAPACGGAFVERANFATTTCADGKSAAECYVATVDYSKAALDDNDMNALAGRPLLVRGTIVKQTFDGKSCWGKLVVTEVWAGAAGGVEPSGYASVSGVLYRVKDSGVRCITTPCPTDYESKLNGTTGRYIAGVDFSAVGATDEQISDAYLALTTSDGALVDGSNTPVSGPGGSSVQLTAANFYGKVAHQSSTGGDAQACGGFAGIQCADPTAWCDPDIANACGGADLSGVCKPAGDLCSQIYLPVCGCDAKTYANDCERVRAKIQKAHDGACAA